MEAEPVTFVSCPPEKLYLGVTLSRRLPRIKKEPKKIRIGNTSDPGAIGESTATLHIQSAFTASGWDFQGESVNGSDYIWRMCVDGVDYPPILDLSGHEGDSADSKVV